MIISVQYPTIAMIVKMTIQNLMASLFSDHPESNGQAPIKRFLHINTSKMSYSSSNNSFVHGTPTSCALGGLYSLKAGG